MMYLAVAIAALAVPGLGQQTPTPVPSVSAPAEDKPAAAKPPAQQVGGLKFVDVAEVTIVNVDVAVADKKGPVLTLKPSDFSVFQDGREQPITNFALYRESGQNASAPTGAPISGAKPAPTVGAPTSAPSPSPTPLAGALPAPRREPRFITMYVDSENILPFNRNRVINSAVEWVGNHLSPPDQAMVVSYQRSVKILQPFTSDPEEVASALRATKKLTGARTDAINGRKQVEDFISQNAGSNPGSVSEAIDEANSFAREQRNNLEFTVGALKELVAMMSGLPGKKAVIYVSDGLPMAPGMELYYEIEDRYQNPNVLSLARDNDATDLMRGLVTAATAAGVTFYTIDARGLESESGIEAENRAARSSLAASVAVSNYQDSLIFMAEQTGGIAVLNSNDPTVGLNHIAADLETFYSLGYRLIPSGEDRRHRIEVKVKGHPEYKLNYRRTFIEKSLQSTIGDRVVSGLEFDLEDNPLGIELKTADSSPAENERWMLPIEAHVPLDKIALIPDGPDLVGYLMVYYAARDNDGKQSDLQRIEQTVRMPSKDYDAARRQYFTVSTSLLLEPGTYRISVGVRDELTNQAGYATIRRAVHPEKK
jgi:VWFA-related protein